jgi:hypothetical protein
MAIGIFLFSILIMLGFKFYKKLEKEINLNMFKSPK